MLTRVQALTGIFALLLSTTAVMAAAPAAFAGGGVTYSGAFDFEGIANQSRGAGCSGEGTFGEMKPRARVTISERDSSGDFTVIAKGRVRRGSETTGVNGDTVCRMPFKATARKAPADSSTVYLEIKGVAFDIQYPASDVADGDLGTWTCEFSDTACARVVGAD